MLSKLDAAYAKPKEKGDYKKLLEWAAILFLCGLLYSMLQNNLLVLLWDKYQFKVLYTILLDFKLEGFFKVFEILLLFFIAKKSKFSSHSAILAFSFLLPYHIADFINVLSIGSAEAINYSSLTTVSVLGNIACVVVLTFISYLLWYAFGEGKIANIIGVFFVGATFAGTGYGFFYIYSVIYKIFNSETCLSFTVEDYIKIITAAAAVALFIFAGMKITAKLRATKAERKAILKGSIILSIILGAVVFFSVLKTVPISINSSL